MPADMTRCEIESFLAQNAAAHITAHRLIEKRTAHSLVIAIEAAEMRGHCQANAHVTLTDALDQIAHDLDTYSIALRRPNPLPYLAENLRAAPDDPPVTS